MKILFVHQNFPAQFKHLFPELVKDSSNEIVVFTMNDFKFDARVKVVRYTPKRSSTRDIHPWLADTETKVIRAEAAYRAALQLKQEGFEPDLIVAHPGWGESLFLKQVWPNAKMIVYCEFFYATHGTDLGFDPEFAREDEADACRVQLKNINNFLHFEFADAGMSPTEWQKSTFPEPFRSKISVIHDGIDTDVIRPSETSWLQIGDLKLTKNDEIITFVNRNLEPYRGYHIFMRSLPTILKARPNARVLIVGGDQVSYGASRKDDQSWKQVFLDEVKDDLDMSRVHFLGRIDYKYFIPLLQISTVHVYLTYPFVLSWSLLEAMACGCAIVASDTAPLREAIVDKETGRLVNFFDPKALAQVVSDLVENRDERARLGAAAREFARSHYDLRSVCLPAQIALINKIHKS
jgi:glycosyltransferase involved in cell wall biosynthesis